MDMDISISRTIAAYETSKTSAATRAARNGNAAAAADTAKPDQAYALDIGNRNIASKTYSKATIANAAAASTKNAAGTEDAEPADSAAKTKGLSADQISALKSDIDKSYDLMIQVMTENNAKLQGYLSDGIGKLNFDGTLIDASRFALPNVATTPEEAQKAITTGDWSVDAVSSRITDLAFAIAGNDPDKLQKMQDAIEKGFKQAGLTWKDATGQEKMPEITQQTHDRINQLFDDYRAKLNGTSTATTATGATAEVTA